MTSGRVRIRLEPLSVEFDVVRDGALIAALAAHGVEFPCGGAGQCGVRVARRLSPYQRSRWLSLHHGATCPGMAACLPGARSGAPRSRMRSMAHEDSLRRDGHSVRARNLRQATQGRPRHCRRSRHHHHRRATRRPRLGDILGVETALNPQAAFGSDVMSRIRAALEGSDLTTPFAPPSASIVARLAAGRPTKSPKSSSSATPSCIIFSAASTSSPSARALPVAASGRTALHSR